MALSKSSTWSKMWYKISHSSRVFSKSISSSGVEKGFGIQLFPFLSDTYAFLLRELTSPLEFRYSRYYTKPRFTKDIDIWIPPELNDPTKVYSALKSYGAPLKGVSPKDFSDRKLIYQIGVAPVRVDIMMGIESIAAMTAWQKRVKSRYGKTSISILSKEDLIKAKKKAGRPDDLLDVRRLEGRKK